MRASTIVVIGLLALAGLTHLHAQTRGTPSAVTLYENARLISGDGSAPIENAAFLVENARVTRVGRPGEVQGRAGAARAGRVP